MIRSRFLRSVLAAAALLGAGEAAWAQSAECQRYRAELAALDRGGNRQAAAQAERQRGEIGRLVNYYRSVGCDRGPLGFFGGPAPAECGPMAQRIRQMEAAYAQLAAQASDFGNVDARRRQLQMAVEQTCNAAAPQQNAAAPRGFFERLFGVPPQGGGPVEQQPLPPGTDMPPTEEPALGGRRLACVRTCDGYYFPLSNAPGGRESADEMCQALCPGTETIAFGMPGSDDAITRAVSVKGGKPYMSLPTALKYQKSFDGNCSCKKETESWTQVLRRAEGMLEQRRGDILVTEQKSEELSRPKAPAPAARKPDPKRAASDAVEAQAVAEAGAAAPTASQESSGIGPRSIENSPVVSQVEGAKQEVMAGDGSRKAVRVIAPNVVPVPQSQKP